MYKKTETILLLFGLLFINSCSDTNFKSSSGTKKNNAENKNESIVLETTNETTPEVTTENEGESVTTTAIKKWTPLPQTNAPRARDFIMSAWTGTEIFAFGNIWPIEGPQPAGLNPYNPETNSWEDLVVSSGEPANVWTATSVWTGSEIIVWSGHHYSPPFHDHLKTGAMFDPVKKKWRSMSVANSPQERDFAVAIWTGSKMVVWGGLWGPSFGQGPNEAITTLSGGGCYTLSSDLWEPMSTVGEPTARMFHGSYSVTPFIWTGKEVLVFGGIGGYWGHFALAKSGARYDPEKDTWAQMTIPADLEIGYFDQSSVWTGSKMIVWGGFQDADLSIASAVTGKNLTNIGYIYNPNKDDWKAISTEHAPSPRGGHIAVWTGKVMIVWGGKDANGFTNTGGIYDPSSDSWSELTTVDAPSPRSGATAYWTGNKMVVFAGHDDKGPVNSGAYYEP